MTRTEHSFWLLPAEPLATRLRAVVADLAEAFGAAPFEPHVTLYCGASDDATTRTVMEAVAQQSGPVELMFARLDATEEYTKTLFIQFEERVAARKIFEAVRGLFSPPSDYALNPHLSLIYSTLPMARKLEIMRTLTLPKGEYRFDRLRAIETEIPLTQSDQIRRWRVVCDRALSARAG